MKISRFPHTILIIAFIMIALAILTWLIPAGKYERILNNGRMVIVPGTFKFIENQPQGISALLTAPIKGFISAAQIIGFCLANIPYQTWIKWFYKLLLLFFAASALLLVVSLYAFGK